MAHSGKLPVLTRAGRQWLTLSVVLLIIGTGTGNWIIAVCGLSALCALLALYLAFFPTAVLLWRRYLEMVWWIPRPSGELDQGLRVYRHFPVTVLLRNLGPLPLGVATFEIFRSRCVEVVRPMPPLRLPAHSEVSSTLELRASQAGEWFLHGGKVRLFDRLELFSVEAYFPSSTPFKVLPRQGPRATLEHQKLRVGAPDERLGMHTLRHRGLGGELRELREYAPGDPFKLIAWKPSARAPRGRLLVRDMDRETLLSHSVILDIGASMREGPEGSWKLDHALELCLAYARAVLDGGDLLGLVTFDGGVASQLRPAEGPTQRLRVTERLLQAMRVVDPRHSGVGDAEMCALLARYLRQQEGLDARVYRPPAIDDHDAWARLIVTEGGALYDLHALAQAARRGLEIGAAPARGGDPLGEMDVLRRFCQKRGIELPYRGPSSVPATRPGAPGGALHPPAAPPVRAAALAEALALVASWHSGQRVILLSDLAGILHGAALIQRSVALCRRRGHRLLCVFPETQRYLPRDLTSDPGAAGLAEILGWEVRRREAEAQAALSRMGVPVVGVGPEEDLTRILARAARPAPGRQVNLTYGKLARISDSALLSK